MIKPPLPTRFKRAVRQWMAELPGRLAPFQVVCSDAEVQRAQARHATVVPKNPVAEHVDPQTGLPIPPRELWAGYGNEVASYLLGKTDVARMRDASAQHGLPLEQAGRILELGCSAGRMIRWLHDLASKSEIWGVDITPPHIRWCQQFLSPPFHFALTATQPHLPFEDRFFGFIYAGSVFTHLDDLAESWFQELRRVLRPGGRLYITLHDRNTMAILDRCPDWPLAQLVASRPEYAANRAADFGVLTLHGADWTDVYVFHDIDYLCNRLRPFFRTLSMIPEAYGYQTALLLERI